MSAKVSVFIATSLDGYIAREDGGLDWLDEANATVPEGEDCGYAAFMETVDVLVMGRHSYEKVLSFGPWPYGKTSVVVLSREPISFATKIPDSVTHSSESPKDLSRRLAEAGAKHLYVDGGKTIQRFLRDGLVDEMTITVIPTILGSGISLFGPVDRDVRMSHLRTKTFDCGFVQSTYRVVPHDAAD